MNLFITGIGTNVGKTVVAAIYTEALKADYWKPIQSGTIEGQDSETVRDLITNSKTVIHPEAYLLHEPLSPNIAAQMDGVSINLNKINLPVRLSGVEANLIIEGAGGVLVPINNEHFVIDIAKKNDCEIVVVVSNYLGCINHTMLTLNYLHTNHFKIHSVVLNGHFDVAVKQTLLNFMPTEKVIYTPTLSELNPANIQEVALEIAPLLSV